MKNRRNKKIVTMVMAMIFALSNNINRHKRCSCRTLTTAVAVIGIVVFGLAVISTLNYDVGWNRTADAIKERGSGDKKDQEDKSIDRSDSDPYAGD